MMKKENEKTILDKLDEIGAPVHNILDGTESEYKGFVPIKMPALKGPPAKSPSPISQQRKSNKKKKAKKKAKRKLKKKSKRRK